MTILYKLKLVYPYPLEKKDTPMQHRQNIHPEISSTCFLFPFKASNLNYFQDCLFLQSFLRSLLSLATVSISFLAIFCFARRLVFPPHQHFCHGEPSLFSASYNTLRRKSCLKEKTRSPYSLCPRAVTHLSGTVSYIPPKKLKLQVEAFSAPPSRSSSHRWIQALSVGCVLQFQFVCHSLDECTMYIAVLYRSCLSYQLFCLKLKHKPYKQINNKSRII